MRKLSLTLVVVICLTSLIYPLNQSQSALPTQSVVLWSVEDDVENASGCTNVSANNYDVNATKDDGSCDFDLDDDGVLDVDEIAGCTNSAANNFVANATDDDGSCTYLNYENGSFQHHYWQGYSHGALIRQHEDSFVKFSPDGSYYATHHDGIIQIWDTNNASITHSVHKTISDFSGYWVVDLDWAPDGDQIAIIVTGNLMYRSVTWSSEVMTYDLTSDEYTSLGTHYYNRNYDIEYSPDGSYVSAALGNEIVVYDLLTGEKIVNYSSGECTYFCDYYNHLSWGSSTMNLTLVLSMNGYIKFYDFESQSIINSSDGWYAGKSMKFSPDGNMIAVCTNDDDVRLYELENLTMVWELTTPETYYSYIYNSACNEIAWAPDSTRFAIAYDGNGNHGSSVLIYDVETSAVVDWFGLSRQYDCQGWDCASIEGLDWSPDGERIIFAADYYQQGIHTWIFDDNIEFIPGCTDYTATNYDPNATRLDYSCRFIQDNYPYPNYHQSYWDFCEWDDNIGEYLCWMEDLNDLSAAEIEELEDCEQSENGCETELNCQEIHRTYGTWECAYYDHDDDNHDNSGTSEESSFSSEEIVIFTIIGMIVFVIVMLNTNKRNSGVSKIGMEYNDEELKKEEIIEDSSPKSIEINLQDFQ